MEASVEVEDLEFKWGKKREIGVQEKDVQFYESFTYDGSEYFLYDCVSVCNASKTDSPEFFVGKIIRMWEHNDRRQNPRRVELLWFFKPYEISLHLKGVHDVLDNELFLASGTGIGLINENQLEAISGKCYVLCISKDIRNPQPSDEEIKLADFLFHRTFDVGTQEIVEKIDDKIAGVDVKYIFNRTSCEKKSRDVQKVATRIHGTADSLKPNFPSTSSSVRQNECNANDFSGHRKSVNGYKKEGNKDSGRHDGELDCCNAYGSRRNDFHGNEDQNKFLKQLTRQNSRHAEGRCSKNSKFLDDLPQKKRKLDHYGASSDGRKDMMVEKSRLAEERYSQDSYCLDDMRQKKGNLDDSVVVSDGRTEILQKRSHDSRKDIKPIRSLRDKVTGGEAYSKKPSFSDEKQHLQIPKFSERKETKPATKKDLYMKPSFDCKISKRTEGNMLTDDNYRRHFRVFEVTRKPDAEKNKWYRNLPWEENLRCAEDQGNVVLLQNLDPTYTSNEVENIVYSALNEQCTARMIEQTLVSIPHIGEALVIFKTMDAAKRAIRRLGEGCLLLSNGRILVATNAKVNPPTKPPLRLFTGHIKPKPKIQQEMKGAVATSHCSKRNTVEFDMGMDWCLHQSIYELTWKRIFERQIEEMRKLKINLKPKHA